MDDYLEEIIAARVDVLDYIQSLDDSQENAMLSTCLYGYDDLDFELTA